ncbi:MAG: hypothetical protein LBJ89_00835 [Holosporales bacterium]|jgi:hypothetical protein|nr:hypothetical protein [Holosporales bacterium]
MRIKSFVVALALLGSQGFYCVEQTFSVRHETRSSEFSYPSEFHPGVALSIAFCGVDRTDDGKNVSYLERTTLYLSSREISLAGMLMDLMYSKQDGSLSNEIFKRFTQCTKEKGLSITWIGTDLSSIINGGSAKTSDALSQIDSMVQHIYAYLGNGVVISPTERYSMLGNGTFRTGSAFYLANRLAEWDLIELNQTETMAQLFELLRNIVDSQRLEANS